MALPQMSIDRPKYSGQPSPTKQSQASLIFFLDLHLLSKHRWSIQTIEHFALVPSALRNMDSRSVAWKSNIHGAGHGRRESAQTTMEIGE
jgi:hypothetical protein